MSAPRYPTYRDTGVEWLGAVPSHWQVSRLNSLFREVSEPGSDDLPILSVSIHSGVSDTELTDDEMDRVVARSEDRSKYKRVEPNDLVYNMMRAWQGGFGAVQTLGAVSPAYVVARPTSSQSTVFIERLLRTPNAVREMKSLSKGVTDFRLRLYWDEFKNIKVALPPPDEQLAIDAFLDRETAKIDALVEGQERLIALLKEKRQAVIAHAVTKGLDPSAPMKDSGVEWLGRVPAHWEVRPLKALGEFNAGAGFPHEEQGLENEPLQFHKVNALSDADEFGYLTPGENTVSHETALRLRAHVFPAGSIVFAKIGAALLLGRIRQLSAPACLDNNMMGFTHYEPNVVQFLRHSFALVRFDLIANPGTVPSLNAGQIANFVIPVPPPGEQLEIARFIDHQIAKLNELMRAAGDGIELLKERRAALISAAVTGKIDVRGLVQTAEAA